jgi:NAD+ kinase
MTLQDKKVLVVANGKKPLVVEQLKALQPFLREHVSHVETVDVNSPELPEGFKADLCIVMGGDGTLLAASRLVAPLGIPIVGVNLGKLGFLADFSYEQMCRLLPDMLLNKLAFSERMMLQVCSDHGGSVFTSLAMNDVAVVSGPAYRMIELHVSHGSEAIASYLGDGVVVSTPTGSTGYNLALGGPILEPTVQAIIITPIAPHSLAMRPLVVPSGAAIRITTKRVNPGTSMVIDGQLPRPLGENETVEIHRSLHSVKLITHPERKFFARLTEKLKWGTGPHRL